MFFSGSAHGEDLENIVANIYIATTSTSADIEDLGLLDIEDIIATEIPQASVQEMTSEPLPDDPQPM